MPTQPHRTLMLPGPAGKLEAILWENSELPEGAEPHIAALACHPHPLYGGTMHNKVVYQVAKTLHRFGVPVLRFNFRGAGLSEGKHDNGRGEGEDVQAALDFLASQYPAVPLLLAGFSFGAWVGLRAGCADPRVVELLGLGLPVRDVERRGFSYLDQCTKPKLLVSGEFDQFGSPAELRTLVERLPTAARESTQMEIVSGGDHFFAGHLPDLDRVVASWFTSRHPDLTERDLPSRTP